MPNPETFRQLSEIAHQTLSHQWAQFEKRITEARRMVEVIGLVAAFTSTLTSTGFSNPSVVFWIRLSVILFIISFVISGATFLYIQIRLPTFHGGIAGETIHQIILEHQFRSMTEEEILGAYLKECGNWIDNNRG